MAPEQGQQGSLLDSVPPEPAQPSQEPGGETNNPRDNHAVLVSGPEPTAESIAATPSPESAPPVEPRALSPAAALAAFVDELLLSSLHDPRSIDELAVLLDVSKTEARRWCLRLVSSDIEN